jgi:hypothetical protein
MHHRLSEEQRALSAMPSPAIGDPRTFVKDSRIIASKYAMLLCLSETERDMAEFTSHRSILRIGWLRTGVGMRPVERKKSPPNVGRGGERDGVARPCGSRRDVRVRGRAAARARSALARGASGPPTCVPGRLGGRYGQPAGGMVLRARRRARSRAAVFLPQNGSEGACLRPRGQHLDNPNC